MSHPHNEKPTADDGVFLHYPEELRSLVFALVTLCLLVTPLVAPPADPLAMLMLTGVNLLQHDGCQPDDPYRTSRNFTGRVGNWLFLNNGFHTAHHLRPELHWSRLRQFHEQELEGLLPDGLNEGSILAFLVNRYLLAPGAAIKGT